MPADGRLFVAATLEIEEGALTGESVPVLKDVAAIAAADVGIGDRHCLAFMNTSVTRGRGEMIVTTTGMGTEIGHIADLLNQTEADKTPLQKQLDKLTVTIACIAGVAFVVMLLIGISNDDPFDTIFTAGIALAIAAIPCGLPAVVTTMYSMGTRALADLGAIVKRLPSVETLGSVSAVCSDKTGTLTLNKMTAREFVVPGQHRYTVTGEGYSTTGEFLSDGGSPVDLDAVLMPMALCADARLDEDGELIGDPTEGALIVLAAKGGLDLDGVRARYPRVAEVPFDSDYKFMATFHEMTSERGQPVVRCFVKGAPDVLISRGGSYWLPGGEVLPVTDENRHLALEENDRIAGAGERVMVVARRDFDPATFDASGDLIELVQDLTLLAMVGIVDPPRAEAKAAIAECHSAGIQVRMITGDHAVTAAAIGRELGIEGDALTGAEFAALSDARAGRSPAEHRRGRSRRPGGQGASRPVAAGPGQHRVDDGRRRQRRAGAEEGRHRCGHGDHRDGGLQGGRHHDPHRRQLRDDREGGEVRPGAVREPLEVHPVPDDRTGRVHHELPRRGDLLDRRWHPVLADLGAVHQLHHPGAHRDGARIRPTAAGRHEPPTSSRCRLRSSAGPNGHGSS